MIRKPTIAVITCRVLPEPDPDQGLLLDALTGAGARPRLVPWDDPGADLSGLDLGVFRSCWNYYENPTRFLEWVARAETRFPLANPASVVRDTLHKGYLRRLQEAGIPVVPTEWFSRGDPPDLTAVLDRRGWTEVVIKPAVSAASFRTRRFPAADAVSGQRFLQTLAADGDGMIQPYLPSVDTGGERALVIIDGELTHAVTKSPRFAGEDERVDLAPTVSDEERGLVEACLACVEEPLLYARVDVMRDHAGSPLLSELELIEPSLFLLQHPPAGQRLVRGILARSLAP